MSEAVLFLLPSNCLVDFGRHNRNPMSYIPVFQNTPIVVQSLVQFLILDKS